MFLLVKRDAVAFLGVPWEDAYRIGYDFRDGSWWAQYIGTDEVLAAEAAEELRHKIRDELSTRFGRA